VLQYHWGGEGSITPPPSTARLSNGGRFGSSTFVAKPCTMLATFFEPHSGHAAGGVAVGSLSGGPLGSGPRPGDGVRPRRFQGGAA